MPLNQTVAEIADASETANLPALQAFSAPLPALPAVRRTGAWAYALKVCLLAGLTLASGQLVFRTMPQVQAASEPASSLPAFELMSDSLAQLNRLAWRHHLPLAKVSSETEQRRIIRTVVAHLADRYGVPRRVALGLSGHESGGWQMWDPATLEVIHGDNPAQGQRPASRDWGVMQINDRAHPAAFPRARRELAYNLDYGLRFLAGLHRVYAGDLRLGFGDWDATLAAYHLGHPPDGDELPGARRYLQQIAVRSRQPEPMYGPNPHPQAKIRFSRADAAEKFAGGF